MIRNYFTLYHAAMELHERLAGGHVNEIFSQRKNELTISFIDIDGRHLQIVVVTHTPLLSFFLREGVHKKARNAANLMSVIKKQQVSSIDISPYDREIRLHLGDASTIVLQLFTSKTNVFLVRENRIIDAFKLKNSLAGQSYASGNNAPGVLRELEVLAMNTTLFLEQFSSRNEESVPDKLSAILPGFDRTLVREMIQRTTGETNPEKLFTAFQSLFYELLDPRGAVSENEHGEPEFSLLPTSLPQTRLFDAVLEGVTDYSISMQQFLDTKEKMKEVRSKLLREVGKKQKAIDSFNPEMLEEFARNYERSGHLLMASLYLPRTDRKYITVPDIFEPGTPDKTIPLKEALTLQKNAEEYFLKASKTRGKLTIMLERHARLEQEKTAIEARLAATDTIRTSKEALRFVASLTDLPSKSGVLQSKNHRSALPFRIVQLSPSVTLLIGKNAENNDLLTFTYARPNDIWLHARGASGSHCVLKGATQNHRDEINKAAEIAAWYSAAKHSELVPVIYTLKKYVRHSRQHSAGQVLVEREKVVLVRPSKEMK